MIVQDDKTVIIEWTGLLNGDTGAPVAAGRWPDKTVQVTGVFHTTSGGDVDMEGTNEDLGSEVWGQLHDPQGVLISIGDVVPLVISESPNLIRPNIAGGDAGTDLTVRILAVARGV
jgi:hypothetical protein